MDRNASFALALLLPLLGSPGRASGRVPPGTALVLMSEPMLPCYREALEGVRDEWELPLHVAIAGRPFPPGPYAVIFALGGAAARAAPRKGVPTVSALAPGDRRSTVRVALTPSPEHIAGVLHAGGVRRLLAVRSAPSEAAFSRRARAAAEAAGIVIEDVVIAAPGGLPAALRRAGSKADGLWLTPEPAAVTPENFAAVREYARARRIPFFAPAAGLVGKDSLGDLAVSFRDCGREAARAARELLAGRPVARVVYPGETTVR